MYICACKAVTDRTIDATIAAGARCPDDVARMCAAGSGCGGCRPAISKMIEATVTLRSHDKAASAA